MAAPIPHLFIASAATPTSRRPDSTSSERSRTFLENSINWAPIVEKYKNLKEAGPVSGGTTAAGGAAAAVATVAE